MGGRGSAIRVALVDDHAAIVDAMRRALSASVNIVGTATSTAEALQRLEAWAPDVLALDWNFPDGNPTDLLARLKRSPRAPRMLIFSGTSDPEGLEIVVRRAGADGFLSKSEPLGTLLEAIRELHAGRSFFRAGASQNHPAARRPNPREVLSAREFEVFECLGRGMKSREIAQRLSISQATVRTHVSAIIRRLSCSSREVLIATAVRWVSTVGEGRGDTES